MNRPKNITILLFILPACVLCALIMMWLDQGGTRLLKFILYVAMFASIFSPAFTSSRFSCARARSRSRK